MDQALEHHALYGHQVGIAPLLHPRLSSHLFRKSRSCESLKIREVCRRFSRSFDACSFDSTSPPSHLMRARRLQPRSSSSTLPPSRMTRLVHTTRHRPRYRRIAHCFISAALFHDFAYVLPVLNATPSHMCRRVRRADAPAEPAAASTAIATDVLALPETSDETSEEASGTSHEICETAANETSTTTTTTTLDLLETPYDPGHPTEALGPEIVWRSSAESDVLAHRRGGGGTSNTNLEALENFPLLSSQLNLPVTFQTSQIVPPATLLQSRSSQFSQAGSVSQLQPNCGNAHKREVFSSEQSFDKDTAAPLLHAPLPRLLTNPMALPDPMSLFRSQHLTLTQPRINRKRASGTQRRIRQHERRLQHSSSHSSPLNQTTALLLPALHH